MFVTETKIHHFSNSARFSALISCSCWDHQERGEEKSTCIITYIMIHGADSSLGGRIETGIGAIVVHQLRVLQSEGPSPGRRFSCPLSVGYDIKRLNLPSRCITYEFFKTRVLAGRRINWSPFCRL